MTIARTELQVSAGLANDFDLRTLHYGVLLHWRRADAGGVREVLEYREFVDSNTNPLRLLGIEPDDDRIEFERGHGTALDELLVRRSAFLLAPKATPGQAEGSLQQVFAVLKPKKGNNFQAALGLTWVCGPDLAPRACPPEGPPPIRVWYTQDWRDCSFIDSVPFQGDVSQWAEALGRRAQKALAELPTREAPAANGLSRSASGGSAISDASRRGASSVEPVVPVPVRADSAPAPDSLKWSGKRKWAAIALVVFIGAIVVYRLMSLSPAGQRPKVAENSQPLESERGSNRPQPVSPEAPASPKDPSAIKQLCKNDPFPLHCELNLNRHLGEKP